MVVGGRTPSSHGGGGYPIQSWLGDIPGTPHHPDLGWGTPHHPDLGWGTPLPSRPGMGYPPPSRPGMGYPPSSRPGMEYPPPPSRLGMGYPTIQTWDGYPTMVGWGTPPSRPGMGYPPSSRPGIGYPPTQTWDRVPPPPTNAEQTDIPKYKYYLPSYYVRGW